MDIDLAIRITAFNWLSVQTKVHGDVLPRTLLQAGFTFEETQIPLVSPQGIFKPKFLDLPLSITTTPDGPYNDSFSEDGFLVYKYRGTDPSHRDNVALRKTIESNRPLVYFHGIVPGRYLAVWPVYVISDDPVNLSFRIAADDMASVKVDSESVYMVAEQSELKRAYLTATVKQRLHQRSFREKVLAAYRTQCAFCRLRHRELLDASHIIPDQEVGGQPTVNNGMALCKLHHAAFDSFLLGVTPDYLIVVREDVLDEVDGPILKHGLQELHKTKIILPWRQTERPSREALSWRYEQFKVSIP
ncbi:MAG TPA: HNH endonuclease [Chloroflexota bacterium]|nr:HNH endonuclease [Chloroflexota bacterium]HUM70264.1 HNH endonuclease [Chloroflexota bacterium]